jgi:tetratricopeptide (TPR) repeat protein
MKSIFSLLLVLFVSISSIAQNEKALKLADEKFKDFAYVDARQIYLDVEKSGYKSENLYKKLGDSYYFNNELSKSLEWFEKLYNFKKNLEPDYLFKYAMALKSVKKYKVKIKILMKLF